MEPRENAAIIWPPPPTPSKPSPPPPGDSALDLRAIGRSMWRQKWLVVAGLIAGVGAMAAYSAWATPIYSSNSIVAIDTSQKMAASAITLGETRALTAEVGVLRHSIELATRVVGRLQGATDSTGSPDPDALRPAALALLERMEFRALAAEEMIQIVVEGEDPAETARIANLYAEEYEALSRENSRARLAAARRAIIDQMEKRGAELSQLEGQWVAFAQRNGSASQGLEASQFAQEYATIRSARDAVKLEIDQERAALGVLRRQLEEAESRLPAAIGRESDVSGLEAQIAAINTYIAEIEVRAEEFYAVRPGLRGNEERDRNLAELVNRSRRLQERKAELSGELADRMAEGSARPEEGGQAGRMLSLRQDVAEKEASLQQLTAQVGVLDRRAGAYQAPIRGMPRQALTRERLDRRRSQMEQWYTAAVDRLFEVQVAEEAELGYVSFVREATVPALPVRPNPETNLLLGLLLGLGVGVGAGMMREATDLRYTEPEDLEGESHTLIGVVPTLPKSLLKSDRPALVEAGTAASPHMVALLHPWSSVTEHYRLIRSRLEYGALQMPMQVLLVTSPEQGDGKSVTAANLAVVMARNHHRTLLIDADLRRPTGHKLLGVPPSPGLGELLTGHHQLQLKDIMTDVQGLSFLPAGRADVPPSELLGSPAMRSLVRMLREHYDCILIDSPPVMAAPDAVAVAPCCDASLTVASAGRTDRRKLEWTQQTLEGVGTRVVGVILTRFASSRLGRYPAQYGREYETSPPASP